MATSILNTGNSMGFRLSKTLLEQYHLKGKINLILDDDQIIVKPVSKSGKTRVLKFQVINESDEETLLGDDVFEDENSGELG